MVPTRSHFFLHFCPKDLGKIWKMLLYSYLLVMRSDPDFTHSTGWMCPNIAEDRHGQIVVIHLAGIELLCTWVHLANLDSDDQKVGDLAWRVVGPASEHQP